MLVVALTSSIMVRKPFRAEEDIKSSQRTRERKKVRNGL